MFQKQRLRQNRNVLLPHKPVKTGRWLNNVIQDPCLEKIRATDGLLSCYLQQDTVALQPQVGQIGHYAHLFWLPLGCYTISYTMSYTIASLLEWDKEEKERKLFVWLVGFLEDIYCKSSSNFSPFSHWLELSHVTTLGSKRGRGMVSSQLSMCPGKTQRVEERFHYFRKTHFPVGFWMNIVLSPLKD